MVLTSLCTCVRLNWLVGLGVLLSGASLSRADDSLLGTLPEDYVVYAVGTYRGAKPLGFSIDNSGHKAALADVVVNIPNRPVVLVLTAYEPVIWRVGPTRDTKIAGVIVSGYHTQTLGGIDKSTPKVISTHDTPGKFPYFFAHEDSPELLKLKEAVNKLLEKEIEGFINEHSRGIFYVGDPPVNLADILHKDEVDIRRYQIAGRPMPGNRALEQLMQEGTVRLATQEDIDAWVEKASEKYKRFNSDLRVDHHMHLGSTYKILKPMTLPDGMYGSHSRSFLVSIGIPLPGGPRGHNQFYLMDGTKSSPFNIDPEDEFRTPPANNVAPAFDNLPDGYAVFAVGTYGGTQPLGLQIDNSGSDATQADLIVNVADRPVVLALTAYDPVMWRVGRTKDTRLAGVLVSGYHTQLISGLDTKTPRLISTHENQGKFAPFYAYGASEELLAMNRAVQRLVGKEIQRFEFKPQGRTFYVGQRPPEGSEIIYGEEIDLAPYRDPNRSLAGLRGIEQLVNDGKLRRATKEDIEAWIEKAKRTGKTVNRDHEPFLIERFTYVVLKPLTLPDGMYGAHSRAFIVPEGTPFPDGPRCHNQFYLMDGTKRDAGDFAR